MLSSRTPSHAAAFIVSPENLEGGIKATFLKHKNMWSPSPGY